MRTSRIVVGGVAALVVAAAAVWALRPDPVTVDIVTARVGPMEVTVAAEGMTRIRDPWDVTAPLTGIATRSPVEVGDTVLRGETVVAVIRPAEPAFLDARARLQAEAAVTEAQAALRLAAVNVARAEADLAYAEGQLDRNRTLAGRGIIPHRVLEDSEQRVVTARAARDAARSERDLHRASLARAEAQLTGPQIEPVTGTGDCCIEIRAPQTGTVLAVEHHSARLVQAGTPLLMIGDLADLEIEADLLSADAVRVAVGAPAHVERWGGEGVIAARVRRIDPAAFTRVSALGIEEQRVRVRLDILTPPEARAGLGDRYRVFVRIVVWSGEDVLQVPQGALFRAGDADGGGAEWAVFRVVEGRAVPTPVEVGQRRGETAQILSGLSEGDRLVAFPGSRIAAGARVAPRPD